MIFFHAPTNGHPETRCVIVIRLSNSIRTDVNRIQLLLCLWLLFTARQKSGIMVVVIESFACWLAEIAKLVGGYRGDTPQSVNVRGGEEEEGWSLALEAEN